MLMRHRRRLSVITTVALAAAAGVILVGPSLWAAHTSSASRTSSAQGGDYGVLPGYQSLTIDQKLDRMLSLPGLQEVIRGTTGPAAVVQLPNGLIVTDFPLRITEVHSKTPSPLIAGGLVTLRVAGGCIGNLCGKANGAPMVASSEDLFVVVRDQGSLLGGNQIGRVVVSSSTDVLEVRGGYVTGQGDWSGFRESLATFEGHLRT